MMGHPERTVRLVLTDFPAGFDVQEPHNVSCGDKRASVR